MFSNSFEHLGRLFGIHWYDAVSRQCENRRSHRMTKIETKPTPRSVLRSRGTRFGVAAFVASAVLLAPMVSASGASSPVLKSANVTGFPSALVNHSSRTLYVLSSEKGMKLKCTSSCLSTWFPVLVKTSVKTVALGAGVKGKSGQIRTNQGK